MTREKRHAGRRHDAEFPDVQADRSDPGGQRLFQHRARAARVAAHQHRSTFAVRGECESACAAKRERELRRQEFVGDAANAVSTEDPAHGDLPALTDEMVARTTGGSTVTPATGSNCASTATGLNSMTTVLLVAGYARVTCAATTCATVDCAPATVTVAGEIVGLLKSATSAVTPCRTTGTV